MRALVEENRHLGGPARHAPPAPRSVGAARQRFAAARWGAAEAKSRLGGCSEDSGHGAPSGEAQVRGGRCQKVAGCACELSAPSACRASVVIAAALRRCSGARRRRPARLLSKTRRLAKVLSEWPYVASRANEMTGLQSSVDAHNRKRRRRDAAN